MGFDKMQKILMCLLLAGVVGLASTQVESYDIFWQLLSGKYLWQTKSFVRTDLFTLAADVPRWEHCWLHDLIYYGVYSFSGYVGMSLLKGGLVAATAGVMVAAARVRRASILSVLCLSGPVFLLTSWVWLDRPQLWTLLFFVTYLYILERYRRDGGRIVWSLPLLMVPWANLHAGAVLGVVVVGAYLGGEIIHRIVGRLKKSQPFCAGVPVLLLPFLGLFIALLVTPYGLTPLKVLLNVGSLGAASGVVSQLYNYDWYPPNFSGFSSFYYIAAGTCCLLLAAWKRCFLTDLLLLGGLWYMGNTLARHIPFFLLAVAVIMPTYCDNLIDRLRQRWKLLTLPIFFRGAWVVALGIIIGFAVPVYQANGFFNTGLKSWNWPVNATAFVQEQRLPGNLFNQYNYGEYLSWILYPDYKVFFDSRQNSLDMFKKGLQVSYGIIGWEKVLNDYDVNTIVMKACTWFPSERYPLLDRMASSANWSLVFGDESSLVFVRNSAVNAAWLERYALPKKQIYDTVLSEARLLIADDPNRYNAYWELAQVYVMKQDYRQAFDALKEYLSRTPVIKPAAQKYYDTLAPLFSERQ